MATSETDGAHGLPRDATSLANELQHVIREVDKLRVVNEVKQNSSYRYSHRVIQRVNKEEKKLEGGKRTSKRGMIKVSGLSHKRENISDPRLVWLMFQNINIVYRNTKNK